MAKRKISAKQQEILDFMKLQILKKGYPPTVREICNAVNLRSTSSVFSHLNKLESEGYIKRDPAKPRAIEIVDDAFNTERKNMNIVNIPIVGQVAAGLPILATENIESYFPMPSEYVPLNPCFMLRVKGDSMIKAGIFSGDTIMVEEKNTAENGDIVVALIDDSATVKTFYKEEQFIRLQPENDTMNPIYVKECKIMGKVFGVMRFMKN